MGKISTKNLDLNNYIVVGKELKRMKPKNVLYPFKITSTQSSETGGLGWKRGGGQFALDTSYLTIEDGVWRLINIINYITFLLRQARPLTVNYHVWLYM